MDSMTTLNDKPYVASDIKKSLHKAVRVVRESNQDRVYIITGREGTGKSTLAMQFAYEVDSTFCLDRVVFNSADFEKVIRQSKKYQAIVFDEAFNGLSSKGALSKENKRLIRLLMEARQLNLFIFIVLPSFFLLEKYVGIFRSQALFNVMISKKNFKIRYYKAYNYGKKKRLYILGKNLMDYSRPKIVKKHRFYRKFPPTIVEKVYEKKKLKSFHDNCKTKEEENEERLSPRDNIIRGMVEKESISYAEASRRLEAWGESLTPQHIGRICKNAPRNEH